RLPAARIVASELRPDPAPTEVVTWGWLCGGGGWKPPVQPPGRRRSRVGEPASCRLDEGLPAARIMASEQRPGRAPTGSVTWRWRLEGRYPAGWTSGFQPLESWHQN